MPSSPSPSLRVVHRLLQRLPSSRSVLAALTLALLLPAAQALSLGPAQVLSHLGEPLRVDIALDGELAAAEASCLGLAADAAGVDDLPWLHRASLSLDTRSQPPRLSIVGHEAMTEPALRIGIRLGCDSRLRRDYVVLLNPPSLSAEAPPAPPAAPATLPITAARAVAAPARVAAAPRARAAARLPAAPAERAARPAAAAEPARRGDRLSLEPADALALRMAPELGALGAREARLAAQVDERIGLLMAMNDRIQRLESLQARLEAENARLNLQLHSALAQPKPDDHAPPAWARWLPWAAAAVATLWVITMLYRRRHRSMPAAPATAVASPLPAEPDTPLGPADIWPEGPRSPSRPPSVEAPSLSPLSQLRFETPQVEEHDSAVELADILLSFGRVEGAAQTLADVIRANPTQALQPWIKLLEVYRLGAMQHEYDALCGELHRSFNVKPAPWNEFEQARLRGDSLEALPHIAETLTRLWGTRDCQVYLHRLLRDNRRGTRQGFPLAIVDEIMLLLGVLEQSLGPCRVSEEELLGAAPATVAPAATPTQASPPRAPGALTSLPPTLALVPQAGKRAPEAPLEFEVLEIDLDAPPPAPARTQGR